MSCGFTPETFAMIQRMQAEEEVSVHGFFFVTYFNEKLVSVVILCSVRLTYFSYLYIFTQAKKKKNVGKTHSKVSMIEEKIKTVESTEINAKDLAGEAYDWTRKYAAFDKYEDVDELKSQAIAEKKKAENLETKAAMGCNHDHSAVRCNSNFFIHCFIVLSR